MIWKNSLINLAIFYVIFFVFAALCWAFTDFEFVTVAKTSIQIAFGLGVLYVFSKVFFNDHKTPAERLAHNVDDPLGTVAYRDIIEKQGGQHPTEGN